MTLTDEDFVKQSMGRGRLLPPMPPNPGSDEAIEQGCVCAVLDNGHGNPELGRTRGFWITEGCPLHDGYREVTDPEEVAKFDALFAEHHANTVLSEEVTIGQAPQDESNKDSVIGALPAETYASGDISTHDERKLMQPDTGIPGKTESTQGGKQPDRVYNSPESIHKPESVGSEYTDAKKAAMAPSGRRDLSGKYDSPGNDSTTMKGQGHDDQDSTRPVGEFERELVHAFALLPAEVHWAFTPTYREQVLAAHRAEVVRELRRMNENTSGGGDWRRYIIQRIGELEGGDE